MHIMQGTQKIGSKHLAVMQSFISGTTKFAKTCFLGILHELWVLGVFRESFAILTHTHYCCECDLCISKLSYDF